MRPAWPSGRPTLLSSPPALDLGRLSRRQELATAAAAAAVTAAAAAVPAALSINGSDRQKQLVLCTSTTALLRFVIILLALRHVRRVWRQGSTLVAETRAAVEGSLFTEVAPGVSLHHLITVLPPAASGEATVALPPLLLHLNHGFGASALTFDKFWASLNFSTSRPVCLSSHDRTGFGLSSRPADPEAYTDDQGAAHANALLDLLPGAETLLGGHSIGAGLAARMASAPGAAAAEGGRVQALVLIAPALLPPRTRPSAAAPTPPPGASARRDAAASLGRTLRATLAKPTGWLVLAAVRLAVRCVIFSRRFWNIALHIAYAKPANPEPEMMVRYRWPAQVHGADRGVACVALAMMWRSKDELMQRLTGRTSRSGVGRQQTDAEVCERLAALGLPILILHGTADRIVPISNSRALARKLPAARLVEIQGCGHVPHEEAPAEAAEALQKFARECGLL